MGEGIPSGAMLIEGLGQKALLSLSGSSARYAFAIMRSDSLFHMLFLLGSRSLMVLWWVKEGSCIHNRILI